MGGCAVGARVAACARGAGGARPSCIRATVREARLGWRLCVFCWQSSSSGLVPRPRPCGHTWCTGERSHKREAAQLPFYRRRRINDEKKVMDVSWANMTLALFCLPPLPLLSWRCAPSLESLPRLPPRADLAAPTKADAPSIIERVWGRLPSWAVGAMMPPAPTDTHTLGTKTYRVDWSDPLDGRAAEQATARRQHGGGGGGGGVHCAHAAAPLPRCLPAPWAHLRRRRRCRRWQPTEWIRRDAPYH